MLEGTEVGSNPLLMTFQSVPHALVLLVLVGSRGRRRRAHSLGGPRYPCLRGQELPEDRVVIG